MVSGQVTVFVVFFFPAHFNPSRPAANSSARHGVKINYMLTRKHTRTRTALREPPRNFNLVKFYRPEINFCRPSIFRALRTTDAAPHGDAPTVVRNREFTPFETTKRLGVWWVSQKKIQKINKKIRFVLPFIKNFKKSVLLPF